MGVKLKLPQAAIFFMIANSRNRTAATQEVEKLLCQLNDEWMAKVAGYLKEAYGALEGNIRYFKLEVGKNEITKINKIVEPYFSELDNE